MSLFTTTISMFLIMNSVGSIMGYLDLTESLDARLRRKIIVREMFFALIIMLFFYFIGEILLYALEINTQTVSLAGGIILFLIAIRMIFPQVKVTVSEEKIVPFIFPIATPMIAGPSILTTIMLLSHNEEAGTTVISAILIAWAFSITVLFFAQKIKDVIGRRALIALERLMGLLLTMMAVEMLLNAMRSLITVGII